jgi:hypothetical protein
MINMTPAESPVAKVERRAWNYWFVDGLPNLVAGLTCLLVSATVIVALDYRNRRSPLVIILVLVAFGLYMVIAIRFRKVLEWLKSRITYPRTGYAAPPYFTENSTPTTHLTMLNLSGLRQKETLTDALVSEDVRRRGWFFLGILVTAALVGAFIPSQWGCAAAGCAAGLLIWSITRKDERMSWTVVFALLFALMYAMNGSVFPHVEQVAYFMAGVGFVLTVAGAVACVRYLRRNPARQG